MIGVKFTEAREGFFDRAKVLAAMDRKTRKVLSKFGAYTRTRARSSLKYAATPSSPGRPPAIHKTMRRTKTVRKGKKAGQVKIQMVSPLRDFTFFSYDASSKSVIIGPARLGGQIGGGAAPAAIEYGGTSEVKDSRTGGTRNVMIQARPWMGPAAAIEMKASLPRLWAEIPFK